MNKKNAERKRKAERVFYLFFCVWMGIGGYLSAETVDRYPDLVIRGDNYSVLPLQKGQQPFFNRTNMSFGNVPAEYSAWVFTKINAHSGYLPGPLPVLEVKADSSGYLMVMVATAEKPAECARWKEENGWELISGSTLSYATGETGVLSLFRKWVEKDTWVNIVQPSAFSGAMVLAPSIREVTETVVPAVPVRITSLGWMETDYFAYNALAYANRTYVFTKAPKKLTGLQFTRYNGGAAPKLKVAVEQTGDMYIAVSNVETSFKPETCGWEVVPDLEIGYNDNVSTTFAIYKKAVQEGDTMTIQPGSWQGILVFSQDITYNTFIHVTPPPGTVIHNSKAITKKFVGSPSIVILSDGTYLASHDYFGGIISDAFVYRSLDKGETWERISEIKTLNWAKLFTRGQELYMIGVAPKGSTQGYGNVVLLKSEDGGYTWSTPIDSKHGLLREGYYTCAPTPVIFHKGRIWKAMEDQGKVDGWGPFGAFMMSIDEKADLMDAVNWTFSNTLKYTADAVNANTWLEGNAVVSKEGAIKNVLRLNYGNDDKAGIISVTEDGKTATFNPRTDIANLPGACKKFTILYDSISKRYWTLSNYVLSKDRQGNNLERVRNTIVLSYSEDMVEWTIKDTLLHHPDIGNHGFQYADWLVDGDDIVAVFRTAWEDETGAADNQHNANFLTFNRFRNFRYERAVTDSSISVLRWHKGAQSALALTFDDGFEAHFKYAYPVLQKYNLTGTFFVNSGRLAKKGETQKERYGFWEDFKEMSDGGQEIASHSQNHLNLTALDYDVLLKELKQDQEAIRTFVGTQCLTHAYPYCLHDEVTDQVTSSLFIAARQCGDLANSTPSSGMNWMNVNSDLLSWTYPRSLENEHQSFLALKSKLEQLKGNFGVACIHETLPFDLLSTSSTYEIATTEWLDEVCKYLSIQAAEGKVWTTTFSNIVRYAKERESLRISREEYSADSIYYTFSTWLDSTVYNLPLTIEYTCPEEWKAVRCMVRDGQIIVSDSIYYPADGRIMLDVVPDRESLTLIGITAITGINPAEKHPEYTLYPNPVEEILYVDCAKDNVRCEVFSPQGILLKIKNLRSQSGTAEVYMGDLAAGYYYVRFTTQGDEAPLYSFCVTKK